MKRILFLISRFLDGGIDTVLVEYLNNLTALTGHQVTLAVTTAMGQQLEVYRPRLDPRIQVVYLVNQYWLTWYKQRVFLKGRNGLMGLYDELILNPLRRRQAQSRLNRLAADNDVIVDFDSCHSSFIRKEWTAKKIAYFHFSFQKEMERAPRRLKRFRKKIERYDHVVTISGAMLQEGRRLWPDVAGKFVRIYNMVNPDQLTEKAAAPINACKPFFVCVERLEESQKDISTLIEAYSLLRIRLGDNTPGLYIIGKGKDEGMLRQMVADKALEAEITFLGFQANPYPWMKEAVAVVHSAKFEGLPTVLIEALLMDKPIIATDCPTGPREILNQGKSGLLVPVGDAKALANAMQRIVSDNQLRASLQQDIEQHRQLFLPEKCIELFEQLL